MDFNSPQIIKFIEYCLAEDIGSGDHSSLASIKFGTQGSSRILFKDNGVLAGIELAKTILLVIDPELEIITYKKDGDWVEKGTVVAEVKGRVHALLAAERLLLNFMQRLSAIATQTHQVVALLKPYKTKVLDTRKTTPGLRLLEKWAVLTGGGVNHRIGLYDMIMLKDNHIDSAGGIKQAIESTQNYLKAQNLDLKIEVETRNLEEVQQVLVCGGVDRIMLDNFTPELCAQAVTQIAGRAETEASGGITMQNIEAYAAAGVDFISLGYLTHSVKALDISMKTRCI